MEQNTVEETCTVCGRVCTVITVIRTSFPQTLGGKGTIDVTSVQIKGRSKCSMTQSWSVSVNIQQEPLHLLSHRSIGSAFFALHLSPCHQPLCLIPSSQGKLKEGSPALSHRPKAASQQTTQRTCYWHISTSQGNSLSLTALCVP